jgi:hypothetical protein
MSLRIAIGVLTAVATLLGGIAAVVSAWDTSVRKSPAQPPSQTTTLGNNSPAISNIRGDVHIKYEGETKYQPVHLDFVNIRLPRNNEKSFGNDDIFSFSEMDDRIVGVFDDLVSHDDRIVYIRFSTYVGAGIGLDEVPKNQSVRAGVIFEVAGMLDGFGGNVAAYDYGYTVSLDTYREKWHRSREITLLFPRQGNAFFDVHYVKSMNFEGVAKIKVSGMQGLLYVEIIPIIPTDDLLLAYNELKKKIGKADNHEF